MVRFASILLLLALVVHLNLELFQMDVKTAFLNVNVEKEIYMDQPIGFVLKGQETKCITLKGSYIVLSSLSSHGTLYSIKSLFHLAYPWFQKTIVCVPKAQ